MRWLLVCEKDIAEGTCDTVSEKAYLATGELLTVSCMVPRGPYSISWICSYDILVIAYETVNRK